MIQRFLILVFLLFPLLQHKLRVNDRYPDLPVQITSLEWELNFHPSLSHFTSTATYTIRLNRDHLLSFWMVHSSLNIRSVKVNGLEVPTLISTDSLRIGLRESSTKGSELRLTIEYQAAMSGSFFHSLNKVYWSSGFRTDIRSFIPVIDHPRIKFKTQITAHHPRELHFVTNGVLSTQIRENDKITTSTYVNRSAVPVSGLRIVLGHLDMQEVQVGILPIRLYTISPDTHVVRNKVLLERIQSEISRVSTSTRMPYSFEAFHAVLLPESFGQAWGDGAGIGYIFEDIGDLNSQVSLLVSSQWLRQSIQGTDSEVDRYLSIYTYILANLEDAEFKNPSHILTHLDTISQDISVFTKPNKDIIESFKLSDIEQILRSSLNLVSKEDLLEARYRDEWSMRAFPEIHRYSFEPRAIYPLNEKKAGFFVKVNRTEVPGEITFDFEPFGTHQEVEYFLELNTIYEGNSSKQTLKIRASGDSFLLNLGPEVRNVTLDWPNSPNFDLIIDKPLGYWLHQYRNSNRYELKLEAARVLADYVTNQDVGALIRDEIISKETDEYLSFVFRLWSTESEHYIQSLNMKDWLFKDLRDDDRFRLLNQLANLLSIDELSTLAIDYYNRTGLWDVHIQLIRKYFQSHNLIEALRFSEPYLSSRYPFNLRSQVLDEIAQYDQNPRNWMNRIPDLVMDQDPRIRLKALMLSDRLNEVQRSVLIKDRLNKERDHRILAYLYTKSR